MSPTIVFFLSNFKSGGTEWFALRLAAGLAQEGFKPLFLAAQAKGELLDATKEKFEVIPLTGAGYSPLGIACALPALIRFLQKRKPEVVISGLALLNIALAIAIRLAGVRPRIIMVEHMRLCPAGLCPRTLKHRLKVRFLSLAYALADKVVSVSETAAHDLAHYKNMPLEKTRIIYNPVIPDTIDALMEVPAEHPWLREKKGPVLLAVGRLLAIKDYPTLIDAFALARAKKPMKLIIHGEGEERPRLEALIRAKGLQADVALPGPTKNVFSAMRAADLFVLSSRSEAFGNVVAEALACGTPVVCTDCGGPREILENGKWGKLVPPQDANALAQAFLSSLDAPIDRSGLQARGRFFSVAQATRLYAEIIRDICGESSATKKA